MRPVENIRRTYTAGDTPPMTANKAWVAFAVAYVFV